MRLIRKRSQVEAAAGSSPTVAASGAVGGLIVGTSRDRAMQVPALARGRDILCSLVGNLPIRSFALQWTGENLEELALPPEQWMHQPDPRTTRTHMMSWTADDLIFYGRAFWHVTSRYANGRPATFEWLPAIYVSVVAPLWNGNFPVLPPTEISFNGQRLPMSDVICFWSPQTPIVERGGRSIETSLRLESAARKFAAAPTFGWLKQTGGEPLTGTEMADLASTWQAARASEDNSVAGLNQFVDYVESSIDPSKMQLVEARQYSAVDCARLMNIPAYLVNAPSGTGMTYLNGQQASADAVRFGAAWIIDTIEQTLSRNDVTPRGQIVRLDRSAWITETPADSMPLAAAAPVGSNA